MSAVHVLIIARLDELDAAVDLYSCDDIGPAEHPCGRFWETLDLDPSADPTVDLADATLRANGYTRTSDWDARTTASGALRYFADAVIVVDDI